MTDTTNSSDLLRKTVDIVTSYVSNNSVAVADLPGLIAETHGALLAQRAVAAEPEALRPAVPIRRSVTPDYIVCLEDGKKLKMLKRHLKTVYNLSPADYRVRWGLPSDYPMVAPNYAKRRSELAKQIGLGTGTRGRRSA